jgi:hypothetical protein
VEAVGFEDNCFFPPYPLPAYEEMSANKEMPSQSQSKPVTPPGKTITYIRVVQGRKIIPKIPQIPFVKAKLYLAGCISHQTALAKRGPSKSKRIKNISTIQVSIPKSLN